jgi:DNA-binding CsgD family transcriptional regulator
VEIPKNVPVKGEKLSVEYADISGMMSEALLVLDFQNRDFLHVSQHNLLICGYTPEKIKELGYEFFIFLIHPDDLTLWMNIHIAILKSLYENKLPKENIIFFGCTLRIRNFLSEEGKKPDFLMTHLKIKPKFMNGIPRWGVCLLSISVAPQSGNLCAYYDNHDYSTYSFESRKWRLHPAMPLSKRDKQILVLSQKGLSNKEISEKLCISVKTVEQTKTSLFEEQNLNSFSKKIQYANNRCLIYQSPVIESNKTIIRHSALDAESQEKITNKK